MSQQKGNPRACLFVASLNAQKSDEHLFQSVKQLFEQYGNLLHVKVLKDWANRPYAFVQFEREEDAKRALEDANHKVLDHRPIRIEMARVNRTLFLAKYGKTTPKQEIEDKLKIYGPIESFHFLLDQKGQSKGCGFVRFQYREDAVKAFMSLKQETPWICDWAPNLEQKSAQTHYDLKSIFIGHLNAEKVTEALLQEKFEKYGPIENVQLIIKKNSPFYFAFIHFADEESAAEAILKENDTDWLDYKIRVHQQETPTMKQRTKTFPPGAQPMPFYVLQPMPYWVPPNPVAQPQLTAADIRQRYPSAPWPIMFPAQPTMPQHLPQTPAEEHQEFQFFESGQLTPPEWTSMFDHLDVNDEETPMEAPKPIFWAPAPGTQPYYRPGPNLPGTQMPPMTMPLPTAMPASTFASAVQNNWAQSMFLPVWRPEMVNENQKT